MGAIFHPDRAQGLPKAFDALLEAWSALPFDVILVEGVRSKAKALENYAKGRTTPGPRAGEPGFPPLGQTVTAAHDVAQTPHGHAAALDAMPLQANGKIDWDLKLPETLAQLRQMAAIAKGRGLAWGGDWKRADWDHFEEPGWEKLPVVG